jgi:hypothetical protein
MAISTINIGTTANDGTGDGPRAAATKINANFTELSRVLHRRFSARASGILTTNTGPTNTAALQAIIDAYLGSLFLLQFDDEGIYRFAAQGNPATRVGSIVLSRACIWGKSGAHLIGRGEGTILMIDDDQQSTTVRANLFQCAPGTTNFGLHNLRLSGNTANNQGVGTGEYNGTYTQGDVGGSLLAIGDSSGSAGPDLLTLENVWLEDCFGAACDGVKVSRVAVDGLTVRECGEGFQINGPGEYCEVRGYKYRNATNVSVGDAIELVNAQPNSRIEVTDFDIRNAAGGSAMDITGRNVQISDGMIIGGGYGVVVQCDAATASQPNSDNFHISNVHSRDLTGIAISVAGERNGSFRGTINNCHALACERGIAVGQQSQRAEGAVSIIGCTARQSTIAGLQIRTVNKVTVKGSAFNASAAGGYGIMISNDGANAAGQCVVEIDSTTCNDNGRFGVYVQEGHAHLPQGYIHVNANGNQTSNETYWGAQYVDSEIYVPSNNVTGLQIRNERNIYKTALARPDMPVTGEQRIQWCHGTLRQLNGLTHMAMVEVIFNQTTTVEHVSSTAGNNLSLKTATNEAFAKYDRIIFLYDAIAQVGYEISRSQSAVAAFTPESIAGYRCWYKSNAGLWQNTGKTVAAAATDDPVRVWSPAGTGLDLVADSDSERPTRDASGGIKGNGTTQFLVTAATLNLSGPYTIFFRARVGASNTLNRFAAFWNTTNGYSLSSSNAGAGSTVFYENADASPIQMGNEANADVRYAVSVAANGQTTLWKTDGTSISGNGSSGATARSATATMWALASEFAGGKGTGPLRDLILFDRELSEPEIADLRGYAFP